MHLKKETQEAMQKSVDHFNIELKALRTNRASPGLVESVTVEVYGSSMRIKDVASINIPEARQILITPYDAQVAPMIAKAIDKANIGFQAILDKGSVRINVPPMDQALRKQIVKEAHKKAEETKIVVRDVRRKNNDALRKLKADGEITEDGLKKSEKVIQELTDDFCRQIDKFFSIKEKEIMDV